MSTEGRPKVKEPTGFFSRFINWVSSLFAKPPPKTPVNICGRLLNMMICHFRGIIGFIVPMIVIIILCIIYWDGKKISPHITVKGIWILMIWFFLLQPVSIPATSFLPVFLLPMLGILSSDVVCQCYMNEGIILFVLSGMLLLCLNNSGFDRRMALWFICSGDGCQFGGKRLVFKCCTAAFFMSMFSSRLMAASIIIQYITKPLMDLQAATAGSRATEPCYDKTRHILVSATAISCAIGSIGIMHAAPATLAFRTLFHESGTYPDIFNYLQYSAFAFPTAAVMNMVNFGYHMLLINWITKKPMSLASMNQLRNSLLNHKKEMPKIMTRHEVLSTIFAFFYLIVFFTRWCVWLNMGWANYSRTIYGGNDDVPGCMDATTAAIFVITLFTCPKGFSFWNVLCEPKKSKLPPLKMESTILWWRFVDKNLNYAYMFLIGSGVALTEASKITGLQDIIANNIGKYISDQPFHWGLLIFCLLAVVVANMMPGVAGVVVLLPFVIAVCMGPMTRMDEEPATTTESGKPPDTGNGTGTGNGTDSGNGTDTQPETGYRKEYQEKFYLCALAIGIGSSFGFMSPFLYTPAYFCHKTGKVAKLKMAKYALIATILCCLLLWLSLLFWAPRVWYLSVVTQVAPPENAAAPTTTAPEVPGGASNDTGASNETVATGDPGVTGDPGAGGGDPGAGGAPPDTFF